MKPNEDVSVGFSSEIFNQVTSVFQQHRGDIVEQLNHLFFENTFNNRHTLHPRRLVELGDETFDGLISSLSDESPDRIVELGRHHAAEGLGDKTIFAINALFIDFCLEHLAPDNNALMAAAIRALTRYNKHLLVGYHSETLNTAIRQQKEMRKALYSVMTGQRNELFIRNHSLDSCINGILLTDLDDRVTHVNPAFLEMWRFSDVDEVLCTDDITTILGPEGYDIFRSLGKTENWRGELNLTRTNDEKLDVEMSASLIIDKNGRRFGKMASFVDITERKRAEEQLRQSQKMDALGQLAAGITHDFNNMFVIVKGYIQVILMNAEKGSELYDDAKQMRIAIDRGSGLTKQLQYFARGATGDAFYININTLVHETHDLLESIFPKEITLVLQLHTDIWTIKADPSQISHVIMNFCVNARDAISEMLCKSQREGREAQQTGVITITTSNTFFSEESAEHFLNAKAGPYVKLSVTDTGIGISDELSEKLFEPFFTTKKHKKHSGLGLSIIYGIIEKHHGFIAVHSAPEKGATFEVYFPAFITETPDNREMDEFVMKSSGETILIVDDEKQLLDVTSRFLSHYGYRILTAKNGKEAISMYEENRDGISLVVLDLVMPEMDGMRCFKKLIELNPEVKVVVITGLTTEKSAYEMIENKVVGIMEKPFDMLQLTHEIKKGLEKKVEKKRKENGEDPGGPNSTE